MIYEEYWALSPEKRKEVTSLKVSGLDQQSLQRFIREELMDAHGESTCPALQSLNLSYNNIGAVGTLTTSDFELLGKGISLMPNLKKLVLDGNQLSFPGLQNNVKILWAHLAAGVVNNNNFRKLSLRDNNLNSMVNWSPIAEFIIHSTVNNLDVSDNNLEMDLSDLTHFYAGLVQIKRVDKKSWFTDLTWASEHPKITLAYKEKRKKIERIMLSHADLEHYNSPDRPIMDVPLAATVINACPDVVVTQTDASVPVISLRSSISNSMGLALGEALSRWGFLSTSATPSLTSRALAASEETAPEMLPLFGRTLRGGSYIIRGALSYMNMFSSARVVPVKDHENDELELNGAGCSNEPTNMSR